MSERVTSNSIPHLWPQGIDGDVSILVHYGANFVDFGDCTKKKNKKDDFHSAAASKVEINKSTK